MERPPASSASTGRRRHGRRSTVPHPDIGEQPSATPPGCSAADGSAPTLPRWPADSTAAGYGRRRSPARSSATTVTPTSVNTRPSRLARIAKKPENIQEVIVDPDFASPPASSKRPRWRSSAITCQRRRRPTAQPRSGRPSAEAQRNGVTSVQKSQRQCRRLPALRREPGQDGDFGERDDEKRFPHLAIEAFVPQPQRRCARRDVDHEPADRAGGGERRERAAQREHERHRGGDENGVRGRPVAAGGCGRRTPGGRPARRARTGCASPDSACPMLLPVVERTAPRVSRAAPAGPRKIRAASASGVFDAASPAACRARRRRPASSRRSR